MPRFTRFTVVCIGILAIGLAAKMAAKENNLLTKAKEDYRKLNLKPVKPVPKEQLRGPIQECVAEVNAGASGGIDVACSLPQNSKYYFELMAKNESDGTGGFNWKPCETTPNFTCPGANGSWWGLGELDEEGGRFAVQGRIVPFDSCNGHTCDVRARLRVLYTAAP